MHYPKDTILIKGLKKGNKSSFEQLYSKYYSQLMHFAKKYVKSNDLAEDAVHDIFIKIWQKREQLNEGRSLKGFLYTSLKNHVLNLIRDSHDEIYEEYEPTASRKLGRNEAEENLIYQEYQQMAQQAVAKLSVKRRKVFEMKCHSQLSNAQIAQRLGVSVSTVKSQYYRGSQFVKSYLKEHIHSFEKKKL